ncbi:class I SAM-dependent methyltransferase [Dyella caseinilytica]|uniref:Calmodulin-lysine N-methyltransferase n=1 Tax=Dyella caseinilytica TaxID=1849581 RepID=A0ABX7GYV7_9GAMM|nr:methyltransferase domain-containing protein [Dyella caseinilytica]QRN54852.1 methyltransferase domain-containing protein [Dyella caseinilytica]GFZ97391.1 methyltransferase type 12 [Dyella caseinilytica]
MPGYSTRNERVSIGGHIYRLRVLTDKQQFSDPDGHADRLGISSAQWSLFGQVWPSGRLLAQAMHRFDISQKRVLELGCGIGLASLVLQHRGADVVASDVHPLAEAFLAYNAALNELPALHYRQLRWNVPLPTLGHFDLIIASDVLYEIDHAELLAGVVKQHAYPKAEVLVTDPGRGHSNRFSRLLEMQGFTLEEKRCPMDDSDSPPFRGRLLHYTRTGETH